MNKCLLAILILSISILGCGSPLEIADLEPLATSTTVPPESRIVATTSPPATMTTTRTPLADPTPASTESDTPTSTPTIQPTPTAVIARRCGRTTFAEEEAAELLNGLAVLWTSETEHGAAVLGYDGLQNPTQIIVSPEENTSIKISPDGRKIAFYSLSESGAEEDLYSILIVVRDFETGQEYRTQIEQVRLSRYGRWDWVDDSQIIIPIAPEEALFTWLLWTPASDLQEVLTIELPDIVLTERYLSQSYPSVDPELEFVIYPCEDCGESEYVGRHLQSREDAWRLDIGSDPSYDYRSPAIWSPNGEFIAVVGGNLLNQLLIFDRMGQMAYEITLPFLDEPGGIMIRSMTWSPDSSLVAFTYTKGASGQYEDSLSVVDMSTGQAIDLCVNARTGIPIWAQDSTYVAVSAQIQSGEKPRLISVVNVISGDVVQLQDSDGRQLIGWMQR